MRLIPLWGTDLSRHVCTTLILGRQSWAKRREHEEVSLARATILVSLLDLSSPDYDGIETRHLVQCSQTITAGVCIPSNKLELGSFQASIVYSMPGD